MILQCQWYFFEWVHPYQDQVQSPLMICREDWILPHGEHRRECRTKICPFHPQNPPFPPTCPFNLTTNECCEGMLRHDLAMNAPNRSSYDTIRVLIRLDVLSVHTIAYASCCSGWWRFADILLTILGCLWVSSLTIPPKIVAWRFGGELLLFEVIIRRSDEQERSTGWLASYKHVIFCFVWRPDANSKNKRDFLLF